MRVTFRSSKQAWAGLIFVSVGIVQFILATQYQLGTARQMGPGYFPTVLAILMVIFGAAAFVQAQLRDGGGPVGHLDVVPVLFLIAGVVSFALLIERAGLVISIFALVALSSYKRLWTRPLEVFVIFAAIAALTVVIFVYVIKLPIRAF